MILTIAAQEASCTTVGWQAVPGAAAYAVDWSDRSGPAVRFKCAGTTGDTRFPFRRSTHIPYYLRVRALDAAGRQLAESQILKTPVARVLRPQLEALSRGLVAVKANTGVFVSWRLFRSEVAGFDDTGLTGADFVLFKNGAPLATVTDSTN